MKIAQFKYANDNLGYLVYTPCCAIAIDGGNPEEMIAFARQKGVPIALVTNTHTHPDHTMGNASLLEATQARFLDSTTFSHNQVIDMGEGAQLEVLLTPGHTKDSVCFKANGFLVTGDTLFNATVGNCFSGDLDAYYNSLKILMALPEETQIFAGHDYVQESLAAAWAIEKDNPHIQAYEDGYTPDLVVSTLADELKVNPYLRFDAPSVITLLKQRQMPCESSLSRFKSLMEIF